MICQFSDCWLIFKWFFSLSGFWLIFYVTFQFKWFVSDFWDSEFSRSRVLMALNARTTPSNRELLNGGFPSWRPHTALSPAVSFSDVSHRSWVRGLRRIENSANQVKSMLSHVSRPWGLGILSTRHLKNHLTITWTENQLKVNQKPLKLKNHLNIIYVSLNMT